jgi:hypothetical protein
MDDTNNQTGQEQPVSGEQAENVTNEAQTSQTETSGEATETVSVSTEAETTGEAETQSPPTETAADPVTTETTEATGETTEATGEAVSPSVNNIKVTFTGAGSATVEVASGSTAGEALKKAGLSGNLMMRDKNNGVINKTQVLTSDTTITTVAPARGG